MKICNHCTKKQAAYSLIVMLAAGDKQVYACGGCKDKYTMVIKTEKL